MLDIYPEKQYAVEVLRAGASGYISKDRVHDDLIKAIRQILEGKKYSSHLTDRD